MRKRHLCVIGFVFFCTWGWICAGPATGEADESLAIAAVDAGDADLEAMDEPASLFDDDTIDGVETNEALSISSLGQIDIHVKDLEITKVLQLLSIQSQRNIVASRNVAGAVSADLYGVDFYEAMDAILHPNGFGYQEKGNFIYVYTADEMKTMAEATQQVFVKIVRLDYMPAADAVEFVKRLLSPIGSVSVSAPVTKGFQPTMSDAGENSFAHQDTLMIRDIEANLEQIVAVLQELDSRPAQVLVEATILEARLTEDNAFGVDMTILADFSMSQFANPFSAVTDIIDGRIDGSGEVLETTVGQTGEGSSGVRFGFINNEVSVFIKALDSVTDTTVLANPKVMVLNRHRAEILVGERLGYISTVQTETSETQTVEFLDIGTQLTVRPFVSAVDDVIRMEVRPSISDGSTELVGGFVIPNTTNEEMVTNIMVRNGQTVVIGGLFKEDTEITRRQVPFLGDVPIAGWAFRGQDDVVTRSEVIFLITPTIVKDESLLAQGERVLDNIDHIRIGSGENLLPWSRTKQVASHMRDALKFHEAGDSDGAMWHVNMALAMDPVFLEGRRLKEQITGERVYYPHRSVLKDAANHAIEQQMGEMIPALPLEWPAEEPIDDQTGAEVIDPVEVPASANVGQNAQPQEPTGIIAEQSVVPEAPLTVNTGQSIVPEASAIATVDQGIETPIDEQTVAVPEDFTWDPQVDIETVSFIEPEPQTDAETDGAADTEDDAADADTDAGTE